MSMHTTEQEPGAVDGGDRPLERAEAADPAWADMTILPAQFYPPAAPPASGTPEAALMRAVLTDAVQCLYEGWLSADRAKRRVAREALEWLFADALEWPSSFRNICPALGL